MVRRGTGEYGLPALPTLSLVAPLPLICILFVSPMRHRVPLSICFSSLLPFDPSLSLLSFSLGCHDAVPVFVSSCWVVASFPSQVVCGSERTRSRWGWGCRGKNCNVWSFLGMRAAAVRAFVSLHCKTQHVAPSGAAGASALLRGELG